MKNPLLIPELREMLAANAVDEIRDFCEETPPPIAAEFFGALVPDEQRTILLALDAPLRAQVFAELDDDVKLALLDLVEESLGVELLAAMVDERRLAFLETLPEERRLRLRELLAHAPREQAVPVLEDLDEVRAAEAAPPPEEMTAEEIAGELLPHLKLHRFVEGRVEVAPRAERGVWVELTNPPRDILPLVAAHFKIPVDFLTSSLDADETARIETEDGATLITVRIPYFDENNVDDVLYFTIPVGFILTNGMILTICARGGTVLKDFVDGKVRHSAGGHRFVLQVILRATQLYLSHLKQLNNTANIMQKKLEQESRNHHLLKLFNIEKSFVYITTSLKSNTLMLERLRRVRAIDLDEPNEDLIEDIFTECKQAIEMANIYSDILSGMMDAFASVISNNLNVVMRVLTSVTIVMTIPVLVTSTFGMNVALPFQSRWWAFGFIWGVSILLMVLVILFFVKKKWLEM